MRGASPLQQQDRRHESDALGHEGLLTLARKVHAAADDGDPARMDRALHDLEHFLGAHLERERPALARIVPADARLLRRGQERLSGCARALAADAAARCPDAPQRCTARAEELVALLALQARDEHFMVHHPAA